jgi:hypothetical protein
MYQSEGDVFLCLRENTSPLLFATSDDPPLLTPPIKHFFERNYYKY